MGTDPKSYEAWRKQASEYGQLQQLAMQQPKPKETRSVADIAREIKRVWPKVYFGAVPYLGAMLSLDKITDDYFDDNGKAIVRYFLSNATTWRGDDARRIKAELKGML